MAVVHHELHLADHAAMLAMRAILAVTTKPTMGADSRPGFDAMTARTPAPDDVVFEPGAVGGVAGWWCRPHATDPRAAVLYLHGGAFVLGSAAAYRHFAGQIAARAGAATFVADYALAPERPFPAAFDDALAACHGLSDLGVERVALCGDSAGGGLALAMLAQIAQGPHAVVGAAVISPWTDLSLGGVSMESRSHSDPLLSRNRLAQAVAMYLKDADPRDPRASALDSDLSGMPPVQIHVGDAEVLLDDSLRFAEQATALGRICDVHVWDGMIHVFPASLNMLRAAGEALDAIGTFLRDRLREGAAG